MESTGRCPGLLQKKRRPTSNGPVYSYGILCLNWWNTHSRTTPIGTDPLFTTVPQTQQSPEAFLDPYSNTLRETTQSREPPLQGMAILLWKLKVSLSLSIALSFRIISVLSFSYQAVAEHSSSLSRSLTTVSTTTTVNTVILHRPSWTPCIVH